MIIVWDSCTDPWLSKIEDQTLLTIRWRSFLGSDSDKCNTVFAHNGGHLIGYGIKSLHSASIIQDAKRIIVDTPLTYIFWRWLRHRLHHFCRQRQPIQSLCDDFDELPWDYSCYTSRNCWRSLDTDFYDAATSALRTILANKMSNILSLPIWDYAACMIAESVRLKIVDTHY